MAGPDGEEVIDRLTAALEDEDEDVRDWAVKALDRFEVKEPVGVFVRRQLRSLIAEERRKAAQEAANLDVDSAERIALLEPLLDDPAPEVRLQAAEILSRCAPFDRERSLAVIREVLANEDVEVVRNACWCLGWSHNQVMVPCLLEAFRHTDPSVRCHAVWAIDQFALTTPEVLAGLTPLLTDPGEDVRCAALHSLQRWKPFPAALVPAVIEMARGSSQRAGQAALDALLKLESLPPEALPVVQGLLRTATEYNRTVLTQLVGRLGPAAVDSLSDLIQALDGEPDAWRAEQTADSLAKVGPAGVAPLLARLQAEQPAHRRAVAKALVQVTPLPAESLAGLLACLGDAEPETRTAAASALGNLGPAAAPAIPALIQCLRDPNYSLRAAAAGSLGQLGEPALACVPDLLAVLEDNEQWPRNRAADSLGRLLVLQPALLEQVLLLRHSSDFSQRALAARILGHLSPNPALATRAVAVLRELLGDAEEGVRAAAVSALGDLGLVATLAEPDVRRLVEDPAGWVRLMASQAVEKLQTARAEAAAARE